MSELRSVEAFIDSIILQTGELRYPVIILLQNAEKKVAHETMAPIDILCLITEEMHGNLASTCFT